jgi:cytochrome c553
MVKLMPNIPTPKTVFLSSSRSIVLVLFSLLTVLFLGCSQGAYPVDFFPEMHYHNSFKIQEPPSLSAPSDSVPLTGRELEYTMETARQLEMPMDIAKASGAVSNGQSLFATNCVVCHGVTAKGSDGDGPMWEHLLNSGYRPASPGDLTDTGPTVPKADGEVFLIITKGFADAYGLPSDRFVMPPFGKLLTQEERWMLVRYIRSLQ